MAASLRRRLVLILLALTLGTWLVSVIVTALLARQLIDRQIDRQLTHYMDMAHHSTGTIFGNPEISNYYLQMNRDVASQQGPTRVEGFGTHGRDQATNIWFDDRPVLVGAEAPQFPQPDEEGFIDWAVDNGPDSSVWRVLYRHDQEHGIWLAVGIDKAYAVNLGGVTVLRAISPLLVILPVTVAILLWGVRRGLRPLDQLAITIEARKPQLLDPIDTEGVPIELAPVVVSLNRLLDRLQRALASESRFTANAAHELQTPLAAIKAEVQRYQRQAADAGSHDMLDRIAARVSRATTTVTQLLTLARLDPDQDFHREPVNLNRLVIDAVAEEGGLAVDRGLDVRVPEERELLVQGHPEWLKILVRNLVANAFKYSPEKGLVDISLQGKPGVARLRVANDCEPIADEERQRLTDRFYSQPGNTTAGVGLGLSIVARIAELHGAELRLAALREGRGFVVEVDFVDPVDSGSGH